MNFCGTPIPGSPFICRVYDVGQIKVREVPNGIVGKPSTIIGTDSMKKKDIKILRLNDVFLDLEIIFSIMYL